MVLECESAADALELGRLQPRPQAELGRDRGRIAALRLGLRLDWGRRMRLSQCRDGRLGLRARILGRGLRKIGIEAGEAVVARLRDLGAGLGDAVEGLEEIEARC